MYESPIEKIFGDITSKIEKYKAREEERLIYKMSQEIGYNIDKKELIKALQYDRDQYNKGFRDSYNYKAIKEDVLKQLADKIECAYFMGCNGEAHRKKVLDIIWDFAKEEEDTDND